jgi:hypothetical protein
MVTGAKWFLPTSSKLRYAHIVSEQITYSPIVQRDYFGAHTFRVVAGKENPRLPKDRDIRLCSISVCLHLSLNM